MNISVVLRCKNEEQWIGHCIQSIIDYISEPEIIFIDNNSTDDSADVVRMFEHHVDIRREQMDDYSPGKALNYGAKIAKHLYLLAISSHCVMSRFDPDVFSQLEKHCAVFGKQIPVYRGRHGGRRYIWSNFGDEECVNPYSPAENRYFLHNALCLYKKETIIENPFDERLYGKEDRYWANDMIAKNNSVLYNPNIECLHHWTTNGATWHGIG